VPGQLPSQFKVCGGCYEVVYAWDQMPCGSHQALAQRRKVIVGHVEKPGSEEDVPEPPF